MAVCKACNHLLPKAYEIRLYGATPRLCQACGQHQDDPTYHGEIDLGPDDVDPWTPEDWARNDAELDALDKQERQRQRLERRERRRVRRQALEEQSPRGPQPRGSGSS